MAKWKWLASQFHVVTNIAHNQYKVGSRDQDSRDDIGRDYNSEDDGGEHNAEKTTVDTKTVEAELQKKQSLCSEPATFTAAKVCVLAHLSTNSSQRGSLPQEAMSTKST